jgi:hypothetical protein
VDEDEDELMLPQLPLGVQVFEESEQETVPPVQVVDVELVLYATAAHQLPAELTQNAGPVPPLTDADT